MAKRKMIWSSRAKLDLLRLLDYYYQRNGSKTYSRKLNDNFRKATQLIIQYPYIGKKTDIPNVRVLITGNYAMFYKIFETDIELLALWDTRQNPSKIDIR